MFLALDHKETGKTGLEMASGVMSVLVSTKSTKSLRAAGFDSTSSNTDKGTLDRAYLKSCLNYNLYLVCLLRESGTY